MSRGYLSFLVGLVMLLSACTAPRANTPLAPSKALPMTASPYRVDHLTLEALWSNQASLAKLTEVLDHTDDDQTRSWFLGDARISIRLIGTQHEGYQVCRRYSLSLLQAGKLAFQAGTACRARQGQWVRRA